MAARKLKWLLASLLVLASAMPSLSTASEQGAGTRGTVVLLHGLIRSPRSMKKMAKALDKAGYTTCNIGYPSTDFPVETLAHQYVLPAIEQCVSALPVAQRAMPLNFVTHSLGGIIVRQLVATNALGGIQQSMGRAVMLGPPNHGSELVDTFNDWRLFNWMNGPAGLQLGTDANALPMTLGAADFEVGVIAGNGSISLMSTLLPGEDDGKVTVESARLEGMREFMVLPVSHTFMMKNRKVIQQTLQFLEAGEFSKSEASHVERFRHSADS